MKKLIIILCCLFSLNLYAFNLFPASPTTSLNIECKNNICDLYLDGQINEPNEYIDLKKRLSNATKDETIYLHLTGVGGRADGLLYILNSIKTSKAKIISVVDGNIASAHTVLALGTDSLIINGSCYFYIHSISLRNMEEDFCSQESGKDRGLAMYTKCIENLPKLTNFYNKIIDPIVKKVLTADEQKLYNEGHDIILDCEDIKTRLKL